MQCRVVFNSHFNSYSDILSTFMNEAIQLSGGKFYFPIAYSPSLYIELYYFPGRARVELMRWIFVQAGVLYEDIRIAGPEGAASSLKGHMGACMCKRSMENTIYATSGPLVCYVVEEYAFGGSISMHVRIWNLLQSLTYFRC